MNLPHRFVAPALMLFTLGCASAPRVADETAGVWRARAEQNAAIAARDFDRVASFWVEDVVISAGLGSIISGREAYQAAFSADSALTYERRTEAVELSDTWPLAFERGSWRGWDDAGETTLDGRYSAYWIKTNEQWKIRSELFVAMGCTGRACDWRTPQP